MTNKNETTPFLVLVGAVSAVAVTVFALGAFGGSGLLAMGFVLFFTSLVGFTAYIGIRSDSMRHPGEHSDVRDEEAPAEKASCATTLTA